MTYEKNKLCDSYVACIKNCHLVVAWSLILANASTKVDGTVPSGCVRSGSVSAKLSPSGSTALNLEDCLLTEGLACKSKDQTKNNLAK